MDKEIKQMFEMILSKLDSMEQKQDSMDKKQDKMMHILSDIQGKVTKLDGEVEDHENFISQITSIK